MSIWIKHRGEDCPRSLWSGGATLELAIAPEGARYADRDFLWRVSSAAVELEESLFTPLPDYERLIAPLQGELCLSHNGGEPLLLRPYQIHRFSGADETRSRGRCTDFNLMLRRGAAEGEMEALRLGDESRELTAPAGETLLLYCAEGACRIESDTRQSELRQGESLQISGCGALRVRAAGAAGAAVMLCRMRRCGDGGKT